MYYIIYNKYNIEKDLDYQRCCHILHLNFSTKKKKKNDNLDFLFEHLFPMSLITNEH